MEFQESDIQFDKLSDREFEELCFDLLVSYNFRAIIWRQGGADSGRDIEAKYTVTNPIMGSYDETWFVECKHYAKGVPPEELYSKIAWADAEKPGHLLICISSYATNGARQWLEKLAPTKPYKIHLIEGKQLKALIVTVDRLMTKYFIDPVSKLLLESIFTWKYHGILPDRETVTTLLHGLDPGKLSTEELAFIWCVYHLVLADDKTHRKTFTRRFYMIVDAEDPSRADYWQEALLAHANLDGSVLAELDDVKQKSLAVGLLEFQIVNRTMAGQIEFKRDGIRHRALYCFLISRIEPGLEVAYCSSSVAYIRNVPADPDGEFQKAMLFLTSRAD
jgi:hypothetical protein